MEPAAQIGQAGGRSAGIGEGHMTEFKYIVFADLLRDGERGVRRAVGHILVGKIVLHVGDVLYDLPDSLYQKGYAVSELEYGAGIFQQISYAESAAEGFEPHGQVNQEIEKPGYQHGGGGHGPAGRKGLFPEVRQRLVEGDEFAHQRVLRVENAHVFSALIFGTAGFHQLLALVDIGL